MSDDENFMTDRRGIKRAHESPQKINSLFDGEALDVGDECSVDSDYPGWNGCIVGKSGRTDLPLQSVLSPKSTQIFIFNLTNGPNPV